MANVKKVVKKRRERKNIEKGAVHISATFNNTIITGNSKETLVIAIREEDDIEYKTLVSVYINEDNKFVFNEERYEIIGNEKRFVDSLKVELRLKSKGKKNFDKFWIPFVERRGYYYA